MLAHIRPNQSRLLSARIISESSDARISQRSTFEENKYSEHEMDYNLVSTRTIMKLSSLEFVIALRLFGIAYTCYYMVSDLILLGQAFSNPSFWNVIMLKQSSREKTVVGTE